jgi:hypothetical protein
MWYGYELHQGLQAQVYRLELEAKQAAQKAALAQSEIPGRIDRQPIQRFVTVARQAENVAGVPRSGAFALDTKTGQLCRTYTETPSLPPPQPWKRVAEPRESLPLCVELFNKDLKVVKWTRDAQGNPVPEKGTGTKDDPIVVKPEDMK